MGLKHSLGLHVRFTLTAHDWGLIHLYGTDPSGSKYHRFVHDGFVVDPSQTPQTSLPTRSVICAFAPGRDSASQFVPGVPQLRRLSMFFCSRMKKDSIAALFNARTASADCIRASIEYPTIRFENTSFTAHRYSLPSPVQCSVISDSHNSFGAAAANSQLARSSRTGRDIYSSRELSSSRTLSTIGCSDRAATRFGRSSLHPHRWLRRRGNGTRTRGPRHAHPRARWLDELA